MYEQAKLLLVEKAKGIVGEGFVIEVDDHDENDSFGPFSLFIKMENPKRIEITPVKKQVPNGAGDKRVHYIDQYISAELFIDGTTFLYASVHIVYETTYNFKDKYNFFTDSNEIILVENALREFEKWPTRKEMFKHLKNVATKTIRNMLKSVI